MAFGVWGAASLGAWDRDPRFECVLCDQAEERMTMKRKCLRAFPSCFVVFRV